MASFSPRQVASPTTSSKRSVGASPSLARSPGRTTALQTPTSPRGSSSKPSAGPSPSPGRSSGRSAASRSPVSPREYGAPPSAGYFDMSTSERRSHTETKSKLFASLAAGWAGSLSMGVAIGYSLPASRSLGRRLAEGGSGYKAFWFDWVLPVGALLGALGSSLVAIWLGRRCTLALGSMGSLASWIAITRFSANTWHFLLARGAQGVCTGVVSLIAPAYIAEITMAKDRGKQCGAHQTGIVAGVLYTYLVGHFSDWWHLALWCALPSMLTTVLLLRAVESPRWLTEQGRREDAKAALRSLRKVASLADSEFEVIEAIYPKTPTPIMHYILAVLVIVSQQFSGVDVIMQYATGPLQVQFGSTPHDEILLLAVIQLVVTAVAALLMDQVGRLRPLAVSVTLCTTCMMVLGTIYYCASNPNYALDSTLASYLTFGSKIVFSAAFSAGLGPASWVLAVELAPLRGSGFDFGSVCAFYWASALAVISLFATLGIDPISLAILSWVCGGVTFASGITVFILAPDTVGISLESILMEGQGDKHGAKSDVVGEASYSITPYLGRAETLAEQKEDIAPAAALAENDDKPQKRPRSKPDEMHLSGAASSSHSAIVSSPSIQELHSGRKK